MLTERICALRATIVLLASVSASAQDNPRPAERFFTIEQHAPGLQELIKPSAEWQLIGDRYGLTEGPVWVDDDNGGYLLFADLISNVIYKWAPNQGTTVFLEKAGYSGDEIADLSQKGVVGRID